jgi:1-acyl-sn-glycerol-3-phosphate acyltransferase
MVAAARAKRPLRKRFDTTPATYRAMKSFGTWLIHLLYRYEVSGLENLPETGATLIAVNHLHLLDPFAVVPLVPRQIVTLAASKWYNNLIVGSILRLAGVIFVRRGEVDREALRQCLDVLHSGGVLAIAPEGTRSRTGGLQEAKAGIGYLAARSDAVIVPVAIWGVERLRDWLHLRKPTATSPLAVLPPAASGGQGDLRHLQATASSDVAPCRAVAGPVSRVYADRLAGAEPSTDAGAAD